MTTFDKRQEGFEKKFALDEEQKFKAEARRNKLLGLWAAEKLGLTGDAATALNFRSSSRANFFSKPSSRLSKVVIFRFQSPEMAGWAALSRPDRLPR